MRIRDTAARIYPVTISVAGLLALSASIVAMVAAPPDLRWVALAALTMLSALLMLRMPAVPVSFSISDIFIFSAALLFGPATGAVVAGIDAAVLSSQLFETRRSIARASFNVSSAVLAMGVSAEVFFVLTGTPPFAANPAGIVGHVGALAVFAGAYYLLNTGTVAVAVALAGKKALWSVWREHFMPLWPGYAGGAFAAGLGLFLLQAQRGHLSVLAFVMPTPFILYVAFRAAVGRMRDKVDHLTRVNSMYLATIETLAQAVDARDGVTHDHLRRVQQNTMRLARELHLEGESELRALEAAAVLHDIGKLGIPEHILNKPDRLTPTEFDVMKMHARIGAEILEPIGFPFPVVPIVRHHHENWNGTGYPDGLRGEEIPIGARILSVVDCFDALTSDRPYRRAMSAAQAFAIIEERSGVMYDPRVVAALVAIRGEISVAVEQPAARPAAAEAIAHVRQATRPEPGDAALTAFTVGVAGRLGEIVGRHGDLGELVAALEDELALRRPGLTLVLFQYDAQLDALFARAVAGVHGAAVTDLTIGLGLRLTGWVGANRTTIANSEAALDLGNIAAQLRPVPQLCLSAPLVDRGTLMGVLTAYSTSPDPFTAMDVAVFEMLAGLLAVRLSSPEASTVMARGRTFVR